MEGLIASQRKWERQNGLEKTIDDVQAMIDLLTKTRDDIAGGESEPAIALTKLKSNIKGNFDSLNKDAKELHTSITNYGKQLDKKFKPLKAPQTSLDPIATHTHLTNRAIGMHLLREGLFDVASTFVDEASEHADLMTAEDKSRFWNLRGLRRTGLEEYDSDEDMDDDGDVPDLQSKFAEMYRILHALRVDNTLEPAIAWAKQNSDALEARGSNLEFELCRLRFVELYHGGRDDAYGGLANDGSGPLRALEYARKVFPGFSRRYFKETASLATSLAYAPAIQSSPYRKTFCDSDVFEDVANNFTREFCGLLGLSEKSPLYTAVTAGGIALPTLEKLERVMGEVGGQWTSANELPVEIPLPPAYLFHSIFVCPVSKEQGTDENPPMMMPCGHVIAKESLERVSRGAKFKCSYCPNESNPREAKRVYL
ncbi:regulator of gluconeogenesis Rmd5 [Elsinoe ampelina]|uniref:GID complex catalytic subunit 2 n=1 Tax=Elsinoe ampelina TaxID=302913 RepID=A0A6A6G175_9PEZI|nr:regulator of gluconeogenesis Rmd5 [Elsinoe ampelina]